MAPGSIPVLGGMIPKHWRVIAWDEFVEGPVPIELMMTAKLLAISCLTPSRYRAIELVSIAQRLGVQCVVGGRDAIGWARSVEENGLHEMLTTYPSVCSTDCTPELMAQILADAEGAKLQHHYAMPAGANPVFVLPNRDLLNPRNYIAGVGVRSSMGCLHDCAWCTVGGCGYFLCEPSLLEQDLQQIKQRGWWFFLDTADSFGGDHSFVNEGVLPVYQRSGLRWGTEIAVDDLLRDPTLPFRMAKAGCRVIYLGIESVTHNVHKKCSREKAEEAIRLCRRAGLIVVGALILDATGKETAETIWETFVWAAKWLDYVQYTYVALLPGCDLRRVALRRGTIIEDDLEKYDGPNPTRDHPISKDDRKRLLREGYLYFSSSQNIIRRMCRVPIKYAPIVGYTSLRFRRGIPHA